MAASTTSPHAPYALKIPGTHWTNPSLKQASIGLGVGVGESSGVAEGAGVGEADGALVCATAG